MEPIKRYLPGFLLFLASLLVGLLLFKDYGLSMDEMQQRETGEVNYNYIFKQDTTLLHYKDRDYGVSFELPLVAAEKALDLKDTRDVYLLRHLLTHLFFLVCAFCGYVFFYQLFRNQFIACLGFLMLLLMPRLYAHSFFNSKDIPFMGMYLVSLAVSHWAFAKGRPMAFLLLGLVCGYTTSMRLLGILLIAFILFFLFIDIVTKVVKKENPRKLLICGALFLAGVAITTLAFWPFLWKSPVGNFFQAYQNMAHFRWPGTVLFNGNVISALELPWYYIPRWFAISVPVLWILLGLAGTILFVFFFVQKPLQFFSNTPLRTILFSFLCMATPVVMVILLHSVVYDDWRHLYFIYPSFVVLALYGLSKLGRNKKVFYVALGLCCVQLLILAIFMVKNHPYQQVYFNEFVSKEDGNLLSKYELDYWGPSNKQALEYILANDKSDSIKVNNTWIVVLNSIVLPEADRKRLKLIPESDKPDYFIENFRTYPYKYGQDKSIYYIKVDNSNILGIFKPGQ